MIIVTLSRGIAVLFLKGTFMVLVSRFGQSATVKSHVLSNNDLLIVGTGENGRLIFQLRVKASKLSLSAKDHSSTADDHFNEIDD